MLEIIRGTTPNVSFTIPYNVPLDEANEIWVTISQDDCPIVDRQLSNSGVTVNEQNAIIKLTQEETLRFRTYPKAKVGIRMRFQDEAISSSIPQEIKIIDVVKEGVI